MKGTPGGVVVVIGEVELTAVGFGEPVDKLETARPRRASSREGGEGTEVSGWKEKIGEGGLSCCSGTSSLSEESDGTP